MFTQVGVKQLTDFLRTVTAASDFVDCTLVNCELIAYWVFFHDFCRLLIFLKINFLKKFFKEYHQNDVKQFGP